MQVSHYKEALPYLLKSRSTILVWGHHGTGKSSAPLQFCEDNGYKLFNLRLGSQEVGDLIGLATHVTNSKGEVVATKFAPPDWLKELFDFCEKNPNKHAIIHLDEINRARRDILAPVFQMVLDYQLHTYKFPENVYCIASANPNTDDYNVIDLSDCAFLDRFIHIKFAPTVREVLDYFQTCGEDEEIIGFLRDQPSMMESKLTDFSIDEMVKPSRRSWQQLSKLKRTGIPSNLFRELMFGAVGVTATSAFEEYVKNAEKPLTVEEVLADFKAIKKKVASQLDAGRNDMLNKTCEDIEKHLDKEGITLSEVECKNILDFIKALSSELCFSTCRQLYIKNETLREAMDKDKKLIKKLQEAKTAANNGKEATESTKE